nr:hypothetical protein [Candidatus Sigynarchaeum springense]
MVRPVRYPQKKMGGWSQMTCPNGPTRIGNQESGTGTLVVRVPFGKHVACDRLRE